jgi:regulator of protease activity HflC (stomatin/prohibitin superfamily)
MNQNEPLPSLENFFGGNSFWVIAALVLLGVFVVRTIRFEQLTGEQVGVLLDKISGETEVVEQAGMVIYNGLTRVFFKLDKKIQTLEMTENVGRGDRKERDNLKFKTKDGSDVYVDVVVQYKVDPAMAETVLKTSGAGEQYKIKWARDYARSIARNYLGELTTEECYDSTKRNQKIRMAEEEARKRLQPFGIVIDRMDIPQKPRFYREYEEMIKKKKLADQAVLEEKSKALAAKQRQQTMIVEVTNKKNVAVEQFSGEMQQLVIAARAEGEKAKQAANAYYDKETIGAGAFLYKMNKNADAVLARKKAQAEGIEALKNALEGEGGRNMVKMEYAKKLKDIQVSGMPFILEGRTERFEHLKPSAASVKGAPVEVRQ